MSTPIDLISDTATRPTPAMLDAMASAKTGDEQKGEDPTTLALEARVAALLDFERGLFVPSATMANQIALAVHVESGGEVIAHRSAHIVHYEGGGTSLIARAQPFVIDSPRGIFTGDDVRVALRADDPHHPKTGCIVVENTSNGGGGAVWPKAAFDSVVAVASAAGVPVHVDGARLWNAHVASGVSLDQIVAGATTAQVCFSKGLGCPFGAVLVMPAKLWPRARRLKQALGGALRQSGVVTAAMDYALTHHLGDLIDDHRRAAAFASAVAGAGGVVEPVETNLVFFSPPPGREAGPLLAKIAEGGVRLAAVSSSVSPGPPRLRACFHRDITDDMAARAAQAVVAALG